MPDWIALEKKYLFQTYPRYPVVLTKASGTSVWDEQGKKYLDFFSGLSVCNLGHRPAAVVQAVRAQTGKIFHTSNLYHNAPQVKLAQTLCERSFGERVFFSNSGAEANETAIKLARRHGSASGRHEILTFTGSFHGRTLATLAATGQEKFHEGFGPMPAGFRHAPFNDLAAARAAVSAQTCAIMVEPVQGEGGVNVATFEFLKGLRDLCDERDLLLIFDEIQTGVGRCGRLFGYERFGVIPNVMTLAKSLASGLPLGATVAGEKAADLFHVGDHGSTFGGNPVSCEAASAVLKLLKPSLLDRASRMGDYFLSRLKTLKAKYPFVREARGLGLLLGLEIDREGRPIVEDCLKNGLIINVTQKKVLRFLPPLIATKAEVDKALLLLDGALSRCR